MKNRKRALKRTCADFHLNGTTLMYLQCNKRKLRTTNVCRVDGSSDARTGTTDGSAIEVESKKKSVAPRRVVLEGYVEDEIASIHDEVGHSIRGTYQAVNSRLYWNSVQRDCKIFCKLARSVKTNVRHHSLGTGSSTRQRCWTISDGEILETRVVDYNYRSLTLRCFQGRVMQLMAWSWCHWNFPKSH